MSGVGTLEWTERPMVCGAVVERSFQLVRAAARVPGAQRATAPALFHMQWHDEIFPRDGACAEGWLSLCPVSIGDRLSRARMRGHARRLG
jgi:hypothetical protein